MSVTFGDIRVIRRPDEMSELGDEVVVQATCEIFIPYGDGGIMQSITSPGLHGIQVGEFLTDGDEAYLVEVFESERQILLDMLSALGAKPR